jgi:hypothetical protein
MGAGNYIIWNNELYYYIGFYPASISLYGLPYVPKFYFRNYTIICY